VDFPGATALRHDPTGTLRGQ